MTLNPWDLDSYSADIVSKYVDAEQLIINHIVNAFANNAKNGDISANDYDISNYANGLIKYGSGLKNRVHSTVKQANDANIKPLDNWLEKHDNSVVRKPTDKLLNKRLSETDKYMNMVQRNMNQNSATAVRKILTSATNKYQIGNVTKQQAVSKALHEWSDNGIPALIDKAGKQWSPETYVRTVINTQANRAANDVELKRLADNGQDIQISQHAGARPHCAPYQGGKYSLSGDSDSKYPPFSSTSYGDPAGILGINCKHHLLPIADDGSIYEPDKISDSENERVYRDSQIQRGYERDIRKLKNHVNIANQLDDEVGKAHYVARLNDKQAQLRDFLKESGMKRQVKREGNVLQPSNRTKQQQLNQIAKHRTELKRLHAEFGKHGLPQTVDEYRKVLYNKRSNQGLHGYISARRRGVIEPVYTYKDYQAKYNELASELIGFKTSNGTVIKDVSNHTIDRFLGTLHDASHDDLKRLPVSLNAIKETLLTGQIRPYGTVTSYYSKKARATVNKAGKIVTVVPKGG